MRTLDSHLMDQDERAEARLAAACDAAERPEPDTARPTAYERLEEQVGSEFARFVVRALRNRPASPFAAPAPDASQP